MSSGARSWIPWLAAAGVGSLTAVQSRANGSLGTILDSGLHASVVSFAVGLTVLTLVGLAVRRIRGTVRNGPPPCRTPIRCHALVVGNGRGLRSPVHLFSEFRGGHHRRGTLCGGVGLGSEPRIADSGCRRARPPRQTAGIRCAYGFLHDRHRQLAVGASFHHQRGFCCLWASAWVSGEDSLSAPAVALCVIAGIGVAVQQALNGRLTTISREPMAAAWANFAVGSFILTLALLMITATGARALEPLPAGPWWLYLGGIIGATFIATTAWVVGKVGVLAISLLVTAGQFEGSAGRSTSSSSTSLTDRSLRARFFLSGPSR